MSDNIKIISTNTACGNVDSHNLQDCTFRLVDCNATPNDILTVDCDNIWNCNLCQVEQIFYLPWVDNMKFHIQTRFVDFENADPENPTVGWGTVLDADLLDPQGNVLSAGFATISSNDLVAWDGLASYQVLEVDTSLAAFNALTCFYIRIRSSDGLGGTDKEICTQMFRKEPCQDTVLVEGLYPLWDCYGLYYGSPVNWHSSQAVTNPLIYSNALHQWGYLMTGRDSFEKTTFRNRVVQVDSVWGYNLVLTRAVPPWNKDIITRQQLAAQVVVIDNEEYELPDFTLENQWEDVNTMWLFTVNLQRSCRRNVRCTPITDQESLPVIPVADECLEEGCLEAGCFG